MRSLTATGFRALAERAVDDLLRLWPEEATALGEHAYDDRLDDRSDAGRAEQRRAVTAHLAALDRLDAAQLGVDDAVDASVLRTGLSARLFELDELRSYGWDPLGWLPGEALHPLLARDTTPVEHRLRSLAARLAQVPDRLALARRTLAGVPAVHAETAAQQCAGTERLVRDQVAALLAERPDLAPLVRPAQEAAARALGEHARWLAALPGDGDPRLGPELFARRLALVLDSALTPEALSAAARAHLDEVDEELRRLARDWTGDADDPVRTALDRVAQDAPDDATVVPTARRALAEVTRAVRDAGLVQVPDDACEVVVMPEHRRGVAVAYCDAPGPLERGGTTEYAISPTPAGWSPARVRSFYREYNRAMIVNLTVHEAVPGHALQLAHARRSRPPTRVRAVLASGSFVEGWAVHTEALMAERGLGGVPVRLQQLKMQMRMTVNALLDAGVHAGGLAEREGLALLTHRARQEEGEAVGKWRRALLTSGQLSTYFAGWYELAPVLAGRTSYDEVLAHGSPPPRALPALLTGGARA